MANLSIFGPPGTGKSTAIIREMRDSIKAGVDPAKVGLVSFTRAAARELAQRSGLSSNPNVATIHSYAFRLCELSREQVVSMADLREFSKLVKIPLRGANPVDAEPAEVGDGYMGLYSKLRAEERYPEGRREAFLKSGIDGSLWQFEYFCDHYDRWKKASGLVDFNDMLSFALDAENPGIDVLFVDEAQDLSLQQWALIEKWSNSVPRVVIAGDDDQAIYAWGGADPEGMGRFSDKHGSTVVVLGQSHRIPQRVHRLAESVIKRLGDRRVSKEYKPAEHEGRVRTHGSIWSLGDLLDKHHDVLVLYRNHSLRREAEDFLLARGVPYVVQSGPPGVLQGNSGRAAMQWQMIAKEWIDFKVITTPTSKLRPLLRMARPEVQKAIQAGDLGRHAHRGWDQVLEMSNAHRRYLLKLQERQPLSQIKPTVRLSTIHGAKGQEADLVVLINAMTERTWKAMNSDQDSEIRTWYVGVTRTKRDLEIVTGENPVPFFGGAG